MTSKISLIEEQSYTSTGTKAPWYSGWDISKKTANEYRIRSQKSYQARRNALTLVDSNQEFQINNPNLRPEKLMPKIKGHGLRSLSLFSGGGGLDLGFDLAGYTHVASYELLDFAGQTICNNRPKWKVFSGIQGDVTKVNWEQYAGKVDIIHGGPPCQPFSTSGKQKGKDDVRDMIPEFVRAVKIIKPKAFLAENVPGLLNDKFESYLNNTLYSPLKEYTIHCFKVHAPSFGVPQVRTRVIFIGIKDKKSAIFYEQPNPTHYFHHLRNSEEIQLELNLMSEKESLQRCVGIREALGLENIGFDSLAPTLRSTLTGPRHTTSILSSTSSQRTYEKLKIWPNGVQENRIMAKAFSAKDDHFRLSVPDVGIMQGFPESWKFEGPVYKAAGQIGNSVCPPVAYNLAKSIAKIFL
jgi:DNA (cytosine-5)-methyltransferase 1